MITNQSRRLSRRPWVPAGSESRVDSIAARMAGAKADDLFRSIDDLIAKNHNIHNVECVNLNPATNTMSDRALAVLSSGLGTRTSLGYIGEKYEMGLEAIEQIEVIAAELAGQVFNADFVEVRVPSGAMANLYAFMATTKPGDTIIAPPATIGGHVTHHSPGVAGLYGLNIQQAPIDPQNYTVAIDELARLAEAVKPRLITIGASLNLTHHDVPAIREIADRHGALVLFDAAHLSGPIAGGAWPNPLDEGAHLMTMSAYKSLAGPPSGLVVTNEEGLAESIDRIAFPGMTANFDVAKTAALAVTLAEWQSVGAEHATTMIACAKRLAAELQDQDIPVRLCGDVATESHAFAVDARSIGGGAMAAKHLRKANLLTSAIGLPEGLDDGIRIGLNELTRLGSTPDDMPRLASLVARAFKAADPAPLAQDVATFRSRFTTVCFTGESC